ncbi:Putative uncharacterized protein [Moritella viscosa]|uniref:hypothetical protein n=1 Tax=Moritella viscosa TaxID=80854 RepID=UPI00092357E8|nr:hypothetical protein [Moritella viscosa]SGZ09846.1 Putative uncharacterized protein [Moritella viscosa]
MIKVNLNHSEEFLIRYEKYVLTDRLIPSLRDLIITIPDGERELVSEIFTPEFIRGLVLGDANDLHDKICRIYDRIHILAERYCLEYYLKDLDIDLTFEALNIKTKAGKVEIAAIHAQAQVELQLISDERNSIYLPILIANMQGTTAASAIKKQLKLLVSKKSGNHKFNEEEKALYPDWIKDLGDLFNYEAMSQVFGRDITNGIDLNICPYCNNEDIETINIEGAETRPDLDHYYPKSKFPFLALTLSNLIPAGNRCNQKYKRAHAMLGYVHPYIRGVSNNTLFNFNYMFDEGRTHDALDITLHEQNDAIDTNFELFRVEETHNKKNVKTWFLKFEERYQFLSNSGIEPLNNVLDNNDLIRIQLDVDIQQSPKDEQFQKLKVDALNTLSGREFEMTD